jgi:RNA 2',3'-cyclic 3'-phosphodiesterase
VRLFFAIELPSEVRAALGRLHPANDRDYRWVDPAQLHVTLAFLGEQPETALPLLEQIGSAAASASRSAKLRLDQPGSFGPRRSPRVLWLGLEGDLHHLTALHAALAARLHEAAFSVEDREFRPHITLARRRESAPSGAPPPWPPQNPPHAAFQVDHLTLFQSRLSPRGATYHPLGLFPLGH